jgi:predicted alpha/beta hydrolase family esterase
MKPKTQIFVVHGGMTFRNRRDYLSFLLHRPIHLEKRIRWTDDFLEKSLGRNFEIIRPRMPLQDNAKYDEWKLHFERHFPYMRNDIILIGASLGGIFLAKYLSENKFPKRILSIYLVCPPYDNTLPGEELTGGFTLKADLSLLERNSENLYLLFSIDDDVVPIAHVEKFKRKLKHATFVVYKNKNGHFNIAKFPEIVRLIKEDVKRS